MERLWEDVKYACTSFSKNPGFTAMVVLTLAFGIGANTAVFSIVRAVLLRPLPYKESDRLAFVWRPSVAGKHSHSVLTGNDVIMVKERNTTLESFAVLKSWEGNTDSRMDLLLPDGSERLRGALVSPNFFELLGAKAVAGRVFLSSDSDAPVAVLSRGLWQRRFGEDPGIIGRQIRLAGGRPRKESIVTIVGVLPDDFRFTYPIDTEIYLPLPWSGIQPNAALFYTMVARLKRHVSPQQAQAELTTVANDSWRALARARSFQQKITEDVLSKTFIEVEPASEHLKTEVRPGVLLLAGVAGLVLLIACVNLGLLVLSRTVHRTGELALRAALGASPRRILQQLLVEGSMLAALGGVVGVTAAALAAPVIRSLMPPIVPRADQIGVDASVLVFAVLATAVTALVCGLTPALVAMRRDLLESFRHSGTTATSDRAVMFARSFIIGLQAAVVLMLLIGAGLLLQSFWRLQRVDLGFSAHGVIAMEMRLLDLKFYPDERRAAFQENVMARIREIPGVAQASMTTAVPMRGVDWSYVIGPKGGPSKGGHMRAVDADYFTVIGIALKSGRPFTSADSPSSPPVTIVSESFGRSLFGSASPLGKTLHLGGRDIEIIGVVEDVRYVSPASEPEPAFYFPRSQEPSELMCLLIKPQPGAHDAVMNGVRAAIVAVDPDQPVEGITTIDEIVEESSADRRFYALSTAAFASLALILAVAGVFGVVSRLVSVQQREFAIRIALGAENAHLLRLVIGSGLAPVIAGTTAGLLVAYNGSRALQRFMFDVAPTDPLAYLSAAVLLIVVTVAACLVPAVRAMRIQPMAVLKQE